MLTTLLSITKGEASILGLDIVTKDKEVREKIGVALQDTGLDNLLTGKELFFTTCRLWGYSKKDSEKRTTELLGQRVQFLRELVVQCNYTEVQWSSTIVPRKAGESIWQIHV